MDRKNRIREIAQKEFPGSTLIFDERVPRLVKFEIKSSLGERITRAHPHFDPSEIDNRSDEELRRLLRFLCGFSN